MPKLSPWFQWPTKPVHVGWYEFDGFSSEPFLSHWHAGEFHANEEESLNYEYIFWEDMRWRGLTEKPVGHDCERMGCKHDADVGLLESDDV